MRLLFCLLFSLLIQGTGYAQDYHAINGSSFAGSLGLGNNPSSITNCPYRWDVDLLSLQAKTVNNSFTVYDYSLLSSPLKSKYADNNGFFQRYADLNFNMNLLNIRYAIDRKHTVALGFNLRGEGRFKTDGYNYNDSIKNSNQFLGINQGNSVSGNFVSSIWAEIFATYSQTIYEDEMGRLNGGITLKATRGLSGVFAQLSNLSSLPTPNGGDSSYTLNSASARYGYSYNYDTWQNGNSTTENLKNFLSNTRGGFSFDLGFEYLIKNQEITTVNDADNYFEYKWKIGISLLDVGYNQYRYGNKSGAFPAPAANVTGMLIDQKLDATKNFTNFNDSLISLTRGYTPVDGKFKVQNPSRLVLNIDRSLDNHFYVNGELSLNLHPSIIGASQFFSQELNLLTITPRWETRKWGVYLPMQYDIEHRFMVGGAFKIGPLLLGLHNWAYIFSKQKIQNGGGYLALVIRSPSDLTGKLDKRLDCPK